MAFDSMWWNQVETRSIWNFIAIHLIYFPTNSISVHNGIMITERNTCTEIFMTLELIISFSYISSSVWWGLYNVSLGNRSLATL